MKSRYHKAILTRVLRLSEHFELENGRTPTITELNDLYSAEMRDIASRSSRNSAGKGGFAALSPEKALEIRKMGGYARKGTKNKAK